jgi:integrase
VTIRKALQREWDGTYGLGDPKSQRSRRVLTLPGPAIAALAAHRDGRGEAVLPTAYVFSTATGTPLSPRNLVRSFKRALVAASLPSAVRFHDLRHSHNALLDVLGVSARVRMDLLGHSDVRLTENTYNHSTLAQRRDAAERIGAYMESRLATPTATPGVSG